MRSDLPRGIQAAQLVHAAGESVKSPLPKQTIAVVLTAASESALEKLSKEKLSEMPHVLIRETEGEYGGQVMAIGIEPLSDRKKAKKALSSLPLLR